jgi:hypothetical protein
LSFYVSRDLIGREPDLPPDSRVPEPSAADLKADRARRDAEQQRDFVDIDELRYLSHTAKV